jgi:uncharacterized protein YndB with AHSA1/START domain
LKDFDTPILHKVLVKAPRRQVYDAMTTAKGLDGWFTEGTTIDLKPGGEMTLKWVNWGPNKVTSQAVCPIIDVKVPESFVFKWWDDHYTTVDMKFEEVEEGTILSVREYGYENSVEGRRRCLECAVGWGEALTLIKFFVEHNIRY